MFYADWRSIVRYGCAALLLLVEGLLVFGPYAPEQHAVHERLTVPHQAVQRAVLPAPLPQGSDLVLPQEGEGHEEEGHEAAARCDSEDGEKLLVIGTDDVMTVMFYVRVKTQQARPTAMECLVW